MKDTILDTINYLFILLVMMDDWLGHESPAVINRKEVKSIYLAHYVRGNTEEFRQASELEREMIMQQNVTEAIKHGQKLRESFPNIRFYIPGEHEDVYSQAYIDGVISADDIINQCEDIVGLCDMFVTMANPLRRCSKGDVSCKKYGYSLLGIVESAEGEIFQHHSNSFGK